jgi:hypothetical protein
LSLAALLAGCAGGAGDDATASLKEAEAAAENLEVEATATTGVIRGIVVDDALRPLAGANVTLAGGSSTQTTEAGAFGFDGLEPGTYFLTASLADFTTVQQSAEVEAGVSDPALVRILLVAIPRQTPFIEAFQERMYVSGAVSTPVLLVRASDLIGEEGNFSFRIDITPNGTVAQAEFSWESTSPLGENLLIGGGTYDGDDALDTNDASGSSVLVLRANATQDGETADSVRYNMWAGDFDDPPAAYFQQHVDAFVHVFHNFRPDEGWLFTRDGAHPLPP